MASLENSPTDKISAFKQTTSYAVSAVDGKKAKGIKPPAVWEVAPGRRVVTGMCGIVDPKLGGMNVRTGSVLLPFQAKAGVRYKLEGRNDGSTATMWIRNLNTNQRASSEASTSLHMQKTRMVPLPVTF